MTSPPTIAEPDLPPPRQQPARLLGDLRLLPPFELLPMLTDLGKSGLLSLQRSDGIAAGCFIVPGAVARAETGHLTGREAIFTFLWWNEGRFEFEATGAVPEGSERIRVPELLMDAVRLADETERRKDAIPSRERRLALVDDAVSDPDRYDCGLGLVFDHLRQHPGVSCAELEARLPLAPMKVRLAIALLAMGKRIRGLRVDSSGVFRKTAVTWWQNVLIRYPGGIRVLVACCRAVTQEQIGDAVALVSTSLKAPSPTATYASDGPSFVRMRPLDGGLLSLTFLPTGKKHRYLFETFVRSVDAALLCTSSCACGEPHDWDSLVPGNVRLVPIEEPAALHRELGRALMTLGNLATPA